jgi:hypothetical protein
MDCDMVLAMSDGMFLLPAPYYWPTSVNMEYVDYSWNQMYCGSFHTNELYVNTSMESSGVWQTCKAHGNWRISLSRAGQGVLVIHIENNYLEDFVDFVCILAAALQEMNLNQL